MATVGPFRKRGSVQFMPVVRRIVLQKSKVAEAVNFGENSKREDIGDSYCPSRVTELAHEFSVWR